MSKNEITVLLVEDEVTLAMIIKDTLEESGFTIHTAGRRDDAENGWIRNGAPYPANRQTNTRFVSDCPFGHQ